MTSHLSLCKVFELVLPRRTSPGTSACTGLPSSWINLIDEERRTHWLGGLYYLTLSPHCPHWHLLRQTSSPGRGLTFPRSDVSDTVAGQITRSDVLGIRRMKGALDLGYHWNLRLQIKRVLRKFLTRLLLHLNHCSGKIASAFALFMACRHSCDDIMSHWYE